MGRNFGYIGEQITDGVVGLDYDGKTGVLSLTSGYVIPTTTQMVAHAHQDVRTSASPSLTGLTVTGNSVFGLNSSVFQPAAGGDSTTFFQIKNAAGTQVMGFDTTNGRMIIGAGEPEVELDVNGKIKADYFRIALNHDDRFYIHVDQTNSANVLRRGYYSQIRVNPVVSISSAQTGIYGKVYVTTGVQQVNLAIGVTGEVQHNSSGIVLHAKAIESIVSETSAGTITNAYGLYIRDMVGNITNKFGVYQLGSTLNNYFAGKVGFNEPDPETLLELTHAQPYITLHNSTHENTDGGRESRIIFKGEQGVDPYPETELAMLEVSHDGTGNDQLGKVVWSVNTGAGVVQALEIGSDLLATFAGSIELEDTTGSTTGVIYKGADRFIHNYHDATVLEGALTGDNLFIGVDAGNFTVGSTADETWYSSRNIGIGKASLLNVTKGFSNTGIGTYTFLYLTEGHTNFALGYSSQQRCRNGYYNSSAGSLTLYYNQDGRYNSSFGYSSGGYGKGSVTNISYNTFVGAESGYNIDSNSNILIGYKAGYNQTTLGDRLIIDNQDRGSAANELTKALIYGVFDADPANQTLRFNAQVGISIPPTAALTLPVGTATASTAPLKFTSGTDLTAPEAGVIEYDGTHYSITEVVDRRVISVASDSLTTAVTVASTTDETTVFTASISANELHVGKVLRIEGAGQASTHDAADTITVRIKIGTTVLTTLAMVPGQAADDCLHFYNIITIRTTGAGGTIASHGRIQIADSEVHENDEDVALDTTAAEDITVTFQWNDANAGNTATLDQCFLEILV